MNDYERRVYDSLAKKGHIVLRNGWPDFLVIDKNRRHGYGLELKSTTGDLSAEQKAMHAALGGLWGMQVRTVRPGQIDKLPGVKGRILDSPKTRAALLERMKDLELAAANLGQQINQCLHELEGIRSDLDASTVVFEETNTAPLWQTGWKQHLSPTIPDSFSTVMDTVRDILEDRPEP